MEKNLSRRQILKAGLSLAAAGFLGVHNSQPAEAIRNETKQTLTSQLPASSQTLEQRAAQISPYDQDLLRVYDEYVKAFNQYQEQINQRIRERFKGPLSEIGQWTYMSLAGPFERAREKDARVQRFRKLESDRYALPRLINLIMERARKEYVMPNMPRMEKREGTYILKIPNEEFYLKEGEGEPLRIYRDLQLTIEYKDNPLIRNRSTQSEIRNPVVYLADRRVTKGIVSSRISATRIGENMWVDIGYLEKKLPTTNGK